MTTTPQTSVTVSASAAKRIGAILATEPGKEALRVTVSGGGCSGFQYGFELAGEAGEDDLVLERDGIKVYIDSISLMYMEGSEIDFVDDLIGQSFQIKNPMATAACGCGTSFTI